MARNWGLAPHLPLRDCPREAHLFPEASSLCHVFGVGSWPVVFVTGYGFACPGLPVRLFKHLFLRFITCTQAHVVRGQLAEASSLLLSCGSNEAWWQASEPSRWFPFPCVLTLPRRAAFSWRWLVMGVCNTLPGFQAPAQILLGDSWGFL